MKMTLTEMKTLTEMNKHDFDKDEHEDDFDRELGGKERVQTWSVMR